MILVIIEASTVCCRWATMCTQWSTPVLASGQLLMVSFLGVWTSDTYAWTRNVCAPLVRTACRQTQHDLDGSKTVCGGKRRQTCMGRYNEEAGQNNPRFTSSVQQRAQWTIEKDHVSKNGPCTSLFPKTPSTTEPSNADIQDPQSYALKDRLAPMSHSSMSCCQCIKPHAMDPFSRL